jgi:hypothetical protein
MLLPHVRSSQNGISSQAKSGHSTGLIRTVCGGPSTQQIEISEDCCLNAICTVNRIKSLIDSIHLQLLPEKAVNFFSRNLRENESLTRSRSARNRVAERFRDMIIHKIVWVFARATTHLVLVRLKKIRLRKTLFGKVVYPVTISILCDSLFKLIIFFYSAASTFSCTENMSMSVLEDE